MKNIIRPKKRLSQNFLVNKDILNKMALSAQVTADDVILEIGSGPGNLTELLCQRAKFVYAVEIDKHLCQTAEEKLAEHNNFKIINENFLSTNPQSLTPNPCFKVVANLPYHITTPIIFKLLEQRQCFSDIFVTIQKEVAERITAKPGGKDYGILTCSVSFYAKPEILFIVNKSAFKPQPKVDSAFLKLEVLKKPSVAVKDEKFFLNIIKASFGQRRKTLFNALSNARPLGLPKQKLKDALGQAGIDPKRRGETLSLADFARLLHYCN